MGRYLDPFVCRGATGDDYQTTLGIDSRNTTLWFTAARSGGSGYAAGMALAPFVSAVWLRDMDMIVYDPDTGRYISKPVDALHAGRLIPGAVPYFNPFSVPGLAVWEEYQDPTLNDDRTFKYPPELICRMKDDPEPWPWPPDPPYEFRSEYFEGYSQGSRPAIRSPRLTRRDGASTFSCTLDMAKFRGADNFCYAGVRLTDSAGKVVKEKYNALTMAEEPAAAMSFTVDGNPKSVTVDIMIRNAARDTNVVLPHFGTRYSVVAEVLPDSPKLGVFSVLDKYGYEVEASATATFRTDGTYTLTFSVPSLVGVDGLGMLYARKKGGTYSDQTSNFIDMSSNAKPGKPISITNRIITDSFPTMTVKYGDVIDLQIRPIRIITT